MNAPERNPSAGISPRSGITGINLEYARRILQVYNEMSRPIARGMEIPGTAFDILMFLYNNPQYHTARDIVRVRGIKPSHVSVNVDHLVESGYLLREHNPDDRREYLLTLTPKAEAAGARGRIMQERFFEMLLDGVDDAMLQTVQQFFRTVERNMDHLDRGGPDPSPDRDASP